MMIARLSKVNNVMCIYIYIRFFVNIKEDITTNRWKKDIAFRENFV